MKKLVLILIILLNLFFVVNFALAGYQVEITLPGATSMATFTLPQYLSYIYFIGLGAVGIAALGMLVYGGFLYMLSDTVTSKDKAKDYITGALSGLVLGLATYLILNTINPVLLQNQSPNLPSVTMMPPMQHSVDCPTCVAMTVPVKPGSSNKITPVMATLLNDAYARCNSDPTCSDWWVTEGWPPTVNHQSPCHYNGTCVDVNLTDRSDDPSDVKDVFDSLVASGFPRKDVVYEHNGGSGSCNRYRKEGITCLEISQITAPHFSVYQR